MSIKKYLENRAATVGMIGVNLLQLSLLFIFIQIYYSYTNNILGWGKYEVIFLTGIYKISASLFSFLFLRSLYSIPNYIKSGEMDIFLTKPIDTQFFLSFRLIRIFELIPALSGFLVALYALSNIYQVFSMLSWVGLMFGIILGLLIMYGLCFSLATLSVWMGRFDSLTDVYNIIDEPLRYPIDILGKRTMSILTFVVPLGFIVTIPVKVFLGKNDFWMYLPAVSFALFAVSFSIGFWRYALRHYTSASS